MSYKHHISLTVGIFVKCNIQTKILSVCIKKYFNKKELYYKQI